MFHATSGLVRQSSGTLEIFDVILDDDKTDLAVVHYSSDKLDS
jgi:hypothetical protein